MIWILKVELYYGAYAEEPWSGTFEIEETTILENLSSTINEFIDFDNDHMFEFYISRTERSRDRIVFDDENEKLYSTTIQDIFPLEKNMRLFYLFDYGDSWLFRITKSRKKSQKPIKDIKYPRLINSNGNKPMQYPDYDDYEED